MKKKYDESLKITLLEIDNSNSSRLKKKYLKKKAIELTEKYYNIECNLYNETKRMIEEDIGSRQMRDLYRYDDINRDLDKILDKPKPKFMCLCPSTNNYCFCFDYENNKFIR